MQGLAQHIAALAARKPPAAPKPVDLGPIEARLSALENRLAQTPAPSADMATKAELAALSTRVDALTRTEQDIAALGKRVDALTQGAETRATSLAALGARIDTLARGQSDTAALAKRVNALAQETQARSADLASLTQSLAKLQPGAARIERLGRLQVAAAALDAGRPLGTIPDAPPALTRYATTAPPTAAELRLSFPAAASAAARAGESDEAGKPLLTRVWARVRNVVTVRQGKRLVVGNAASDTLDAAQAALDAGDLAGAVAQLSKLQGPGASAMASWLARARALLAARAAIVQMETGA